MLYAGYVVRALGEVKLPWSWKLKAVYIIQDSRAGQIARQWDYGHALNSRNSSIHGCERAICISKTIHPKM